jgi:hypothetical protein
MRFAFWATLVCFVWRALTYAAYTPFLETLHVFFLHMGNDFLLFGPKKHLDPHFLRITVL